MKRLLAILVTLSTLFALSACGSAPQQGQQPSSVSSVPSAGDLSIPEGVPDPEQLPRSCRLYAQESARAGAGEDFPDAPMSPYGMQGLGTSYGVRMADGSFRGLEWGAGMVHGNVPLREIAPEDRLLKEDDRTEVVWAGEKYRSFALSARDCAIPNLMPDEGRGVLRLNIMGDCTVDGGGPDYECFGGFDCVYITGSGTLTLTNTAGLGSGGSSLALPALMIDGDVTVRCKYLYLAGGQERQAPSVVMLGGALYTERLWTGGGDIMAAGGTLLARQIGENGRLVLRDGVLLTDELADAAEILLSGGAGYVSSALPAGCVVQAGAGSLTADGLDQAEIHKGDAAVLNAAEDGSMYCATVYSQEWAPSVGGTAWEDLTAMEAGGRYFSGQLALMNANLPELLPWGGLCVSLSGNNIITGDVGGTSLLFTGAGNVTAQKIGIWGWGVTRAPLMAVKGRGTAVTLYGEGECLTMGSNEGDEGLLLVDGGELTCRGDVWLQNSLLSVRSGSLRADGTVSIEKGRVEIRGGTVTLSQGLWLGEGDIVITGGRVIVPGGLDGLVTDNGTVTVDGGSVREP